MAVAVLLLAPAFALMAYAMLDPMGNWRPWTRLFGPPEDGSWEAVSIDGRPVPPREFRVGIAGRKVVGGRDGCNDWGYAGETPDENGERLMVSTLAACPDTQLRRAYDALRTPRRVALRGDGTLRLDAPGHHGVFRRCRWITERKSGPGYSSVATVCAAG